MKNSNNAIIVLNGKVIKEYSFVIPSTDIERTIIEISKEKNTPKEYPRKAGIPSKKPL